MSRDAVDVVCRLIQERGPAITGIAGVPGAGKTTLAVAAADRVGAIRVSLDDFCYSRAERAERGLRWRAMPGSHDLDLLFEVFERVRGGSNPVALPRYSPEVDDRVEPLEVRSDGRLLIDGWLLGYAEGRYARVREELDLLVFLDVAPEIAKHQRFERERVLREAGGGLSEAHMERFWAEAIEPVLEIARKAKDEADVVIALDADHQVTSVEG